MGGPCYLVNSDGTRTYGPDATDNFQITSFEYDGEAWRSAEQCYQAMKYPKGSPQREAIKSCLPTTGESSWSHGNRVWGLGQTSTNKRGDWEEVKVEVMFLVNCAKFAAHESLRNDLRETGTVKIEGHESTHDWQYHNGVIQSVIRKLINDGVDLATVTKYEVPPELQ